MGDITPQALASIRLSRARRISTIGLYSSHHHVSKLSLAHRTYDSPASMEPFSVTYGSLLVGAIIALL